jgi:mediator of RNA polymerase II transcription subunit 31
MRLHSEGPEPPQSTLNAHLRRHIHNHQLEFVQSLASPAYLHYLATSGILYQSSFRFYYTFFIGKKPEYAKYLQYPHCLYFLDLLVPPTSYDSLEDVDGTTGVDSGEAF